VHIVFMELVIDPACSLVFEAEAEEPGVMQRQPRDPRQPLFSRASIGWGVLQGAGALTLAMAVFVIATRIGQPASAARAATFTSVVISNLFLILGNRSQTRSSISMLRRPNAALWWVVVGSASILALSLLTPWLRQVFHFGAPPPSVIAFGVATGLATGLWIEL